MNAAWSVSVLCVCTYGVSVVVSSNGLSDVTGLDGSAGRFHCSWTALKQYCVNTAKDTKVMYSVLFLPHL